MVGMVEILILCFLQNMDSQIRSGICPIWAIKEYHVAHISSQPPNFLNHFFKEVNKDTDVKERRILALHRKDEQHSKILPH